MFEVIITVVMIGLSLQAFKMCKDLDKLLERQDEIHKRIIRDLKDKS
jgi:hypothetical protein